jgi:hypothetical protein
MDTKARRWLAMKIGESLGESSGIGENSESERMKFAW